MQKDAVGRSRSTGPETASMSGKQMGTAKMKTMNRLNLVLLKIFIFRFSNFVKTGMESYVLDASRITTEPTERHLICVKFFKNN